MSTLESINTIGLRWAETFADRLQLGEDNEQPTDSNTQSPPSPPSQTPDTLPEAA